MANKKPTMKKGFTIIEVVLVLAVAGLIFLMAFVAFPTLQRNQHDTQRRDDYGMLATAVLNYSTNNGGRLYKLAGAKTYSEDTSNKELDESKYLSENGLDPSGNEYGLEVYTWGGWEGSTLNGKSPEAGKVYVILSADCNGEVDSHSAPAESTSKTAFVVYGYLEGGTYCSES